MKLALFLITIIAVVIGFAVNMFSALVFLGAIFVPVITLGCVLIKIGYLGLGVVIIILGIIKGMV